MGSLEQGWKRKRREEGVEEKRGTEGETHIGIEKEGWMIKSPLSLPRLLSPSTLARPRRAPTDRPRQGRKAAGSRSNGRRRQSPKPFPFYVLIQPLQRRRRRQPFLHRLFFSP